MPAETPVPPATLSSAAPYAVPAGGKLVFTYTRYTTDGWPRGDIRVVFSNGGPAPVVARNVPAVGGTRTVKAIGDWAKIFPDPIPVATRGAAS